ncbi:uncharacterized protein LOC102492988 [Tupaia chinensis]|uniref:uncharacterized protein LOC102492988 n=1 Tax=Tupaia chinensis TaxID=246437 RepID=UPI000FFB72DB|nr:uncharacterized protein LOC102492988 [Tupaia chinensis]
MAHGARVTPPLSRGQEDIEEAAPGATESQGDVKSWVTRDSQFEGGSHRDIERPLDAGHRNRIHAPAQAQPAGSLHALTFRLHHFPRVRDASAARPQLWGSAETPPNSHRVTAILWPGPLLGCRSRCCWRKHRTVGQGLAVCASSPAHGQVPRANGFFCRVSISVASVSASLTCGCGVASPQGLFGKEDQKFWKLSCVSSPGESTKMQIYDFMALG